MHPENQRKPFGALSNPCSGPVMLSLLSLSTLHTHLASWTITPCLCFSHLRLAFFLLVYYAGWRVRWPVPGTSPWEMAPSPPKCQEWSLPENGRLYCLESSVFSPAGGALGAGGLASWCRCRRCTENETVHSTICFKPLLPCTITSVPTNSLFVKGRSAPKASIMSVHLGLPERIPTTGSSTAVRSLSKTVGSALCLQKYTPGITFFFYRTGPFSV